MCIPAFKLLAGIEWWSWEYEALERKLTVSYYYPRLTIKANAYKIIWGRHRFIPNYTNRITGLASSLESPEWFTNWPWSSWFKILSFPLELGEKKKERERKGVSMTHFKALFFCSYLWNRQGKSYIGCYLYIGCCLLLRRLVQFCSFFWDTWLIWAGQNCLKFRKRWLLSLPPLTCAVPNLKNLGSCSTCARWPHHQTESRKQALGQPSLWLHKRNNPHKRPVGYVAAPFWGHCRAAVNYALGE